MAHQLDPHVTIYAASHLAGSPVPAGLCFMGLFSEAMWLPKRGQNQVR
jgi:hypothetical protein